MLRSVVNRKNRILLVRTNSTLHSALQLSSQKQTDRIIKIVAQFIPFRCLVVYLLSRVSQCKLTHFNGFTMRAESTDTGLSVTAFRDTTSHVSQHLIRLELLKWSLYSTEPIISTSCPKIFCALRFSTRRWHRI